MGIYIKDVDKTHPVGNLVYEYGEKKFYNGLLIGFASGIVSTYLFNSILRRMASHS